MSYYFYNCQTCFYAGYNYGLWYICKKEGPWQIITTVHEDGSITRVDKTKSDLRKKYNSCPDWKSKNES
jgi:hypothetical protein